MIHLGADEVRRHLPMRDAIGCIQKVMIRVAQGQANLPLRTVMDIDGTNKLGLMPGALSDPTLYGVKLLSLFPGNPARGLSSHIGLVILFDSETGEPAVTLDADAITAIRTAAASAVATDALARRDAACLTIIGTGEQAETHIAAMGLVRNIDEIRIVGGTRDRAEQFIARNPAIGGAARCAAFGDVQEAVQGADIICTVTSSTSVVLRGDWVGNGTHVNAVGASVPSMQEIDTGLIAKSRLFVDYKPSALAQAKDIRDALEQNAIQETDILAEIGDVLANRAPGRGSDAEITLYRSLGIAAQDLAAAQLVWDRAKAAR